MSAVIAITGDYVMLTITYQSAVPEIVALARALPKSIDISHAVAVEITVETTETTVADRKSSTSRSRFFGSRTREYVIEDPEVENAVL